ncbi:MAG: CotH kinase family protein, partial [Agathobacter sp.]|nr:CotH kinase family protein [Agathobacter sp.]
MTKNKKKAPVALKWLLIALVLGVIILVICLSGEQKDFFCYTYDGMGNPIKGYYAKEEEIWYLFVTSSQEMKDVKLRVEGKVEQTSKGSLNEELGEITGAFAKNEDSVELTMSNGKVIRVIAMQSDLPSVYIDLNGTTLDIIHGDKDAKHTGNSIYIQDEDKTYNFGVENTVEIKGRGNSSWREYEKKGYQIKFLEKTSLMGMPAERKWVLLANSSDDSMMRTQLAYHMADDLDMDFVPEFQYVDLWIEGEYLGTYMLGEKVEQGANRLDLDQPTGALFEHDEAFYAEEPYWFYSDALGR